MERMFGTDGVRGVANQELTVELAMKLGQAGAYILTKDCKHNPTILVGCDTRKSGDMLAMALMAGICSLGAKAVYLGVIPTPAVAYLTRAYHADAGVVISASHNPAKDNGIKFFNRDGYKLPDELEDEIQRVIENEMKEVTFHSGAGVGSIEYRFDARDEYVEFAKNLLNLDLSGLKIVVDCACGAAYYTSPKTLKELGADLVVLHNKPDGLNINDHCGSTHIESLVEAVVEHKADLGIAFDGDADRMIAVDENGKVVDGDQLMAICGLFLKEQGKLKHNTIVTTVMSNLGFSLMAKEHGIEAPMTKVGDRYVLELMKEGDYSLGGEQSGHIIFLEENSTGDGLISALHLLEVIVNKKQSLSELTKVIQILPQALINAKVPNEKKYSYMENQVISDAIAELEAKFKGEGRVLIRPSGTEPVVRVMIEGKNQEEIEQEAKQLADLIVKELAD